MSCASVTGKNWVFKKFNDAVNNYAKNLYNKTKNVYKVAAALGHNSINKTKEIYNYMENYDFLENENIFLEIESNFKKMS